MNRIFLKVMRSFVPAELRQETRRSPVLRLGHIDPNHPLLGSHLESIDQECGLVARPFDSKPTNALRLDWLKVCPPDGLGVKLHSDDLFQTPLRQPEIDFETAGGETFVCGNPPYLGGKKQSSSQKEDMKSIFGREQHKNLDYICGFIVKGCEYLAHATKLALVTTNSIAQGTHVPVLWPVIYRLSCQVEFAYESFKWDLYT